MPSAATKHDGAVPVEINMSSLHDWQVKALHDRIGSASLEPYRRIRLATKLLVEILGCDEAEAEALYFSLRGHAITIHHKETAVK